MEFLETNLDVLLVVGNIGRELPVRCACAHSQDPRRRVRHRTGLRTGITGRADDRYPVLHGVERADCQPVEKVAPR